MTAALSDWVSIGRVAKTQGRNGELAVEVLSDVPNRFAALDRIFLLSRSGNRLLFTLTCTWPHKHWLILALAEITSLNDAEPWIGAYVQLPRAERAPAPPGSYHASDLIGCRVFDGDRLIGILMDIEPIPGAPDLLHLEDEQGRELLVPFAQSYIREMAIPQGAIHLVLPEGLLGLNHPPELSANSQ